MLLCVVACGSVLQCVAVFCSVLLFSREKRAMNTDHVYICACTYMYVCVYVFQFTRNHTRKHTQPSLMREAGTYANITIIIDGLDECSQEHNPERNVVWIPALLPPNVRLLVSLTGSVSTITKPDPHGTAGGLEACCQLVKDRLRDRLLSSRNVIEVAAMHSSTQKALVLHMLATNHRRLTKQYEAELGGLSESSHILFLSLCLRFMCWVKPSTDGQSLNVPRSLLSLVDTIGDNLAGNHGEAMTEWTLGFFCAAYPLGLTEMELLDLLSTCDLVLLEQQDTGFVPAQKRVSRRQWACLKHDLVELGLIFATSCYLGATWSFSHVAIEAIVRERLVHEEAVITCLKHLAGLYSGRLKDTMGGRIILSCLDESRLGPSPVYVPPLPGGRRGSDVYGGKGAVMQPGGGYNKRRLTVLPATLLKLTALTGGPWADSLTTLLTDKEFVDINCEAGMGEDLAYQVIVFVSDILLL